MLPLHTCVEDSCDDDDDRVLTLKVGSDEPAERIDALMTAVQILSSLLPATPSSNVVHGDVKVIRPSSTTNALSAIHEYDDFHDDDDDGDDIDEDDEERDLFREIDDNDQCTRSPIDVTHCFTGRIVKFVSNKKKVVFLTLNKMFISSY